MVLDEPQETDLLKRVNGLEIAVERDILQAAEKIKITYKKRKKEKGLMIKGLTQK